MSHYAVAIFHREDQNIDDLLAPYSENLEVEPYIRFTKEEAIAYARKEFDELDGKTDQECYEFIAKEYKKKDADGNLLTTYNPKSKWDWYDVGGRYGFMLRLKPEAPGYTDEDHELGMDSAPIKDLDFSCDPREYAEYARFWEVAVEDQPLKPGEEKDDFITFYNRQFYLDRYRDRETYATLNSRLHPYACITPDGEWHAPGNMGWFGCSSDSPEEGLEWDLHFMERFIDGADPELWITVVDCHI